MKNMRLITFPIRWKCHKNIHFVHKLAGKAVEVLAKDFLYATNSVLSYLLVLLFNVKKRDKTLINYCVCPNVCPSVS